MKLFNALALAALAVTGVSAQVTFEIDYTPQVIADTPPEQVAETIGTFATGVEEVLVDDFGLGGRRLDEERRLDYDYFLTPEELDLPQCPGLSGVPPPPSPPGTPTTVVVKDCIWTSNGIKFKSVFDGSRTVPCATDATKLCDEYRFNFYFTVVVGGSNQILFEDPSVSAQIQTKITGLINNFKAAFGDNFSALGVLGLPNQFQTLVQGDPHFKTWSGTWFDFMGECDMKMIHAPHFDGEGKALDVDIRTKIRYDYSYVESAAIKLGNDTLEVASYGDYFLNGVAGATMPAFVGGYPVTHFNPSKKIHIFEVAINDNEKIIMKTFKDLVSVTVNEVEPKRFSGALGMSGSFDKFGKMIGRDGQTEITDPTDFANEWQIRSDELMLFHVAKGPQHPEQCKLPIVSTSEKRRRLGEGLAREKAERACAHFSGEHFENCVFDVMAVGDIEIAQAGVY